MTVLRHLPVLTVLALGLLAAGCGSDEDPTTAWANDVCTAVSTWKGEITGIVDALAAGQVTRDDLAAHVETAKDATGALVSDLESLGPPETDGGEEAQSAIEELATGLRTDMAAIETAFDDASGVSGLLNAVSVGASTLGAMGTRVTTTVDELQQLDVAGELETAFEQASACDDLRSGA